MPDPATEKRACPATHEAVMEQGGECPICGRSAIMHPIEAELFDPVPEAQGSEQERGAAVRLIDYESALKAIRGPEDSGPWIMAYREAGGGYEGLQAIASSVLEKHSPDPTPSDQKQERVRRIAKLIRLDPTPSGPSEEGSSQTEARRHPQVAPPDDPTEGARIGGTTPSGAQAEQEERWTIHVCPIHGVTQLDLPEDDPRGAECAWTDAEKGYGCGYIPERIEVVPSSALTAQRERAERAEAERDLYKNANAIASKFWGQAEARAASLQRAGEGLAEAARRADESGNDDDLHAFYQALHAWHEAVSEERAE